MTNRQNANGQAVVLLLAGLSLFLLTAIAMAIDAAYLYSHWQMARSAADAAAQSAALSIFHGTNATSPNPFATSSPAAAFTCTTTDARTPCLYASLNGFGGTASDVVTVSFPTSVPGVTSLSSDSVPAVSVNIQRTVGTIFLVHALPSTFNIQATATAAISQSPLANCITALDSGASGAFSVTGNANINLSTCGIAVDSNSGSALSATGNITIQAGAVQVVGGVSQTGNVSITPAPITGVPYIADPLQSVPAPSFNPTATCDFSSLSYTGNNSPNLSPATYCGGLSVQGNAHVTLSPGNYIFRGGISLTGNATITFGAGLYVVQGGGFTATGNVTMTGSGVEFYNTFDAHDPFAPISVTGNFSANLSAPTSGPEQGMLFFEDRNAPTGYTDSFTGNSNETLTGALYFPNSTLRYTGNSSASPQNVAIVADKIALVGNANLTDDVTQAAAARQRTVALVY